jgi:hypothetical protein
MTPESFPIFQAEDGTRYTVRRDLLRYVVIRVAPDGAATVGPQQVGGTFESRHAAVATARQWARWSRVG